VSNIQGKTTHKRKTTNERSGLLGWGEWKVDEVKRQEKTHAFLKEEIHAFIPYFNEMFPSQHENLSTFFLRAKALINKESVRGTWVQKESVGDEGKSCGGVWQTHALKAREWNVRVTWGMHELRSKDVR
jgi:hypothetical protein